MPTHTARRPSGREEITAAQSFDLVARPIDVKLLRNVVANSRNTAIRPERWYEQIGEVHYAIDRGAKIAGYANVTARKVNKDGTPGEVVTSGQAGRIASMFQSPFGGTRGLIERYFTLMKVPGDCYLIRTRENADGTGEHTGYDVIGASEIDMTSVDNLDSRALAPTEMIRRLMLPSSREVQEVQYNYIKPEDFLGRIWRPAIKYAMLANSPMAALDTQCEVLYLLTLGLKGKLLSRLALNGILYWPSEVNDIRRSGTPDGSEPVMDNKAFAKLIGAASWAIQNFEDPRSALPIFASGPAEYADAIKHIILDREIYATDMAIRAEMIEDILGGLDVNKSQSRGDSDKTRFNAWSQTDDELRVNVAPDIETFMWAASRLVLNREMSEANVNPSTMSKYMLWYDLSAANTNTNQAEDARQAVDRIVINRAASRKAMGFKEEDAPTGDEEIRMTGLALNDPYLALFGLKPSEPIDWAKVGSQKKGPNEDSKGDPTETNPGKVKTKKSPGNPEASTTPLLSSVS